MKGGGVFVSRICVPYVILKLCAEFQFPTIPVTVQKVCGVVWWCGGGVVVAQAYFSVQLSSS